MNPPTKRQALVLRFIARNIVERGFAPTYREMAAHFGFHSSRGAGDHVVALVRRELLNFGKHGASRTLTLTAEGWELVGGRVKVAEATRPELTSLPATGYVDPPSFRCPTCRRVFFGRSHEKHVCAAVDLRRAS